MRIESCRARGVLAVLGLGCALTTLASCRRERPSEVSERDAMTEQALGSAAPAPSNPAPTPPAAAAAPEPAVERASAKVFFVGHSLVNQRMPAMLAGIASSARGVKYEYDLQVLNGGALVDHINDHDSPINTSSDFKKALSTRAFDVVVITERVPVKPNLDAWASECHAASIFALARKHNPAADLYVYETWTEYDDPKGERWSTKNFQQVPRWPAWRAQLDADRTWWLALANSPVNQELKPWRPEPSFKNKRGEPLEPCSPPAKSPDARPARLIPAGRGMAMLYDEFKAGRAVGSLTEMRQLFEDNIHLNDTGDYFVAALMFASIYGQSPVGLAHDVGRAVERAGGGYKGPDAATARRLQEIAWQAARTAR